MNGVDYGDVVLIDGAPIADNGDREGPTPGEEASRSRRRCSLRQQNLLHVLACLRIDDDEIDPLRLPRPQVLDGFELQEFVVENRALGISVSVKRDDPGHVASFPRSTLKYTTDTPRFRAPVTCCLAGDDPSGFATVGADPLSKTEQAPQFAA